MSLKHHKAHAAPTKDFFIRMITRDISLVDCILDLLDNCIDGARRSVSKAGGNSSQLSGFEASLELSNDHFRISDNCGGITLNDAVNYAFHFGRRPDAPADVDGAIGLYGIGMKRAIFKMAKSARVESSPSGEQPFAVTVDVEAWRDLDDWDFEITELPAATTSSGTSIILTHLHASVASSFSDPTFRNELIRTIARDYAFIANAGFKVKVNEQLVPDYGYSLKTGAEIQPGVIEYEDDGVGVRIVAGLIQDLEDEIPAELKPVDSARFGWYIVCNDRVIVAADKTALTVWGNQGFSLWHPQYNGFAGFLFMSSDDPTKLPWTTTKREVDIADLRYMKALVSMKELTGQFIAYTNARRADLEEARKAEFAANQVEVRTATGSAAMGLPKVKASAAPYAPHVTISYSKPKSQVKEVAEALGHFGMSGSEVGRQTFDYFRRMELGKK